ncbi:hypothetical protein HN873_024639 [Arachis hypogaea]
MKVQQVKWIGGNGMGFDGIGSNSNNNNDDDSNHGFSRLNLQRLELELDNKVDNSYFMSAIYWDQWFPKAARAMALQGAEILFYSTAIGSEPQDQGLDSRDH